MDPYNSADGLAMPPPNPYAAPAARVAEAFEPALLRKASRGERLGAVLLDSAPMFGIAVAAAVLMALTAGDKGLSTAGIVGLCIAGLAVAGYGIYQLVQLHRTGQTFGKKLLGIRIVRNDGSRAGLGRIFWLRYFVPGLCGNVPILGAIFAIADPLFIFGEEKRCLHDLMADTIVVVA